MRIHIYIYICIYTKTHTDFQISFKFDSCVFFAAFFPSIGSIGCRVLCCLVLCWVEFWPGGAG